jgi:hypothetical protein
MPTRDVLASFWRDWDRHPHNISPPLSKSTAMIDELESATDPDYVGIPIWHFASVG